MHRATGMHFLDGAHRPEIVVGVGSVELIIHTVDQDGVGISSVAPRIVGTVEGQVARVDDRSIESTCAEVKKHVEERIKCSVRIAFWADSDPDRAGGRVHAPALRNAAATLKGYVVRAKRRR